MVKYKNKLVYDANTGEVRDDRKYMSMLEDFWLPRREGGKGTEITTLPGGQNLGELEDVKYFEKKLYKSLCVPISRLNPETAGFTLGRSQEITRDELKFSKFVERLRTKFSDVFTQALRAQCVLKGICTAEEWDIFKENIHYDYIKDNNFSEMKESELMTNRLQLLASVDPYTGRYFSSAWIQRNVLRLNDDQIKEMAKEIDAEKAVGLGLPVAVSNAAAEQQMVGDVEQEQQKDLASHEAKLNADSEDDTESSSKGSSTSKKPAAKSKPKSSSSSKGDLTLEDPSTNLTISMTKFFDTLVEDANDQRNQ
jgi:hypothetical protein